MCKLVFVKTQSFHSQTCGCFCWRLISFNLVNLPVHYIIKLVRSGESQKRASSELQQSSESNSIQLIYNNALICITIRLFQVKYITILKENVLPGWSVILRIVLSVIWSPIFIQCAGNNQSKLVTLKEYTVFFVF